MAGKIIADTIEASGSQISLNVGNVTVLTASSTGTGLTTANITTANITTANITTANITTANIASISGAVVATQANQETATSTTTLVTPARQQFHPSAAKGWASIGGSTANIVASYNVASTVDVSTGRLTIVWDVDFSSASYAVVCSGTGGTALTVTVVPSVRTAGQLDFYSLNTVNSGVDPTEYNVAAFGDQ